MSQNRNVVALDLPIPEISDRAIWELSNLVGFYNMSNHVAIASDMQPNPEYHSQSR